MFQTKNREDLRLNPIFLLRFSGAESCGLPWLPASLSRSPCAPECHLLQQHTFLMNLLEPSVTQWPTAFVFLGHILSSPRLSPQNLIVGGVRQPSYCLFLFSRWWDNALEKNKESSFFCHPEILSTNYQSTVKILHNYGFPKTHLDFNLVASITLGNCFVGANMFQSFKV